MKRKILDVSKHDFFDKAINFFKSSNEVIEWNENVVYDNENV